MMKRLLWSMALLAVMGLSVPAGAAQEEGTIRVVLPGSGQAGLYRVGEAMEQNFRLAEEFGGGIIRREDLHTPELAQWLAGQPRSAGIPATAAENGATVFSGLTEGLYLVVQQVCDPDWYQAEPFLVALPLDGQWEIEADPKARSVLTASPPTGQGMAPLLGVWGMLLSAAGLLLCFIGEKRGKRY